jgi:L-asparaginase / beta-aspartyl-peptidase
MPLAIVVHAGAGSIPAERAAPARAGCLEAVRLGWRILERGGSALDAVEASVRLLEDNPRFNAGTGAVLTSGGTIELDAGMMEGRTLRVGAIAGVELIKNPITLARRVMESPHVLLVGKGAQEFARAEGIALCAFEDLLSEDQYQRWQTQRQRAATTDQGSGPAHEDQHGTVGAVASDASGTLAAATSTGGTFNQYPGRVGDSPLVGCGFYADDLAAVSCTGHGEDFIRLLIAKRAADFVSGGASARDAARGAVALLTARAQGRGGLIVIDHRGDIGFAWNSEHMAYAYLAQGMAEAAGGT